MLSFFFLFLPGRKGFADFLSDDYALLLGGCDTAASAADAAPANTWMGSSDDARGISFLFLSYEFVPRELTST